MIKPLLFTLVVVILVALALNFDLFSNTKVPKDVQTQSIEKVSSVHSDKVKPLIVASAVSIEENNLSKELKALLLQAEKLFQTGKEDEAILIYEKIIAKSKDSKDIKILKIFAEACWNKANMHYMFPTYDLDLALETYELMVSKLKNQTNKELLISYMNGRLQQAQFTSKEELITAYSELISKFQKDKEQRFKKEIEELLFAKSFALMGINDEEAIEVLDSIIAQYDDKSNLPDTVKFSILNNIELSIITSNDTDKYVDLANQYMSDFPDTKPLLDMLSIIKNAQDLDQSEALEEWGKEHSDYNFPDWDFSELRKWVNGMETPEAQERIRQYLDTFEKQKYKNLYQPSPSSSTTNNTYSDENTQNIYPDSYVEREEGEEENSEQSSESDVAPIYEPDPYRNDILNTEPEITYPNPYLNYEPSTQMEGEGVSHTYQESY